MKKYLKVSSLVISFQKRKFVVILNIFSFFYVTNNLSYFSMYQSMHLWKKNFFTLILLPGLLVPDVAINLKLFVRSRGVRRWQAVAAWLSICVGVREGCRRDVWSEGTFEWGTKALLLCHETCLKNAQGNWSNVPICIDEIIDFQIEHAFIEIYFFKDFGWK